MPSPQPPSTAYIHETYSPITVSPESTDVGSSGGSSSEHGSESGCGASYRRSLLDLNAAIDQAVDITDDSLLSGATESTDCRVYKSSEITRLENIQKSLEKDKAEITDLIMARERLLKLEYSAEGDDDSPTLENTRRNSARSFTGDGTPAELQTTVHRLEVELEEKTAMEAELSELLKGKVHECVTLQQTNQIIMDQLATMQTEYRRVVERQSTQTAAVVAFSEQGDQELQACRRRIMDLQQENELLKAQQQQPTPRQSIGAMDVLQSELEKRIREAETLRTNYELARQEWEEERVKMTNAVLELNKTLDARVAATGSDTLAWSGERQALMNQIDVLQTEKLDIENALSAIRKRLLGQDLECPLDILLERITNLLKYEDESAKHWEAEVFAQQQEHLPAPPPPYVAATEGLIAPPPPTLQSTNTLNQQHATAAETTHAPQHQLNEDCSATPQHDDTSVSSASTQQEVPHQYGNHRMLTTGTVDSYQASNGHKLHQDASSAATTVVGGGTATNNPTTDSERQLASMQQMILDLQRAVHGDAGATTPRENSNGFLQAAGLNTSNSEISPRERTNVDILNSSIEGSLLDAHIEQLIAQKINEKFAAAATPTPPNPPPPAANVAHHGGTEVALQQPQQQQRTPVTRNKNGPSSSGDRTPRDINKDSNKRPITPPVARPNSGLSCPKKKTSTTTRPGRPLSATTRTNRIPSGRSETPAPQPTTPLEEELTPRRCETPQTSQHYQPPIYCSRPPVGATVYSFTSASAPATRTSAASAGGSMQRRSSVATNASAATNPSLPGCAQGIQHAKQRRSASLTALTENGRHRSRSAPGIQEPTVRAPGGRTRSPSPSSKGRGVLRAPPRSAAPMHRR
eukprot:TRINITY_DN52821_c0_g1_i1.p1 TRINITY_DN52821_c0_g1~~TRINITY_DN52821_c0_g1_i1.p1  ORF type:complete len:866 (+),score=134.30 TRINITY_DN52821_c0_g1_i1:52-2649(+)